MQNNNNNNNNNTYFYSIQRRHVTLIRSCILSFFKILLHIMRKLTHFYNAFPAKNFLTSANIVIMNRLFPERYFFASVAKIHVCYIAIKDERLQIIKCLYKIVKKKKHLFGCSQNSIIFVPHMMEVIYIYMYTHMN